ncbi:hypothetical protein [Hymenobacter glacieicola]|uniref:Cytosolic carboxypeptidase N-terminal domain-containing protein n=1 Tax=Hymenobacter glacieicola TaxID=1562124 RepID=A0ABQ1WIM1_9BACT|nr:hypothetical protein [Hymenobacter glacieicola]GGG32534.1 hypothetical protein GCM10011378_06170 [Hymenobacter glacieicola]
MPIAYKPLFLLEAEDFSLLEIKALDVQSDDPAQLYFWFQFDKASHHLEKLEFVSMSENGTEQQREFRQGQLAFNHRSGTYTAQAATSPRAELQVKPTDSVPAELDEAIQRYFVAG